MLLADLNQVHIHAVLEPSLRVRELDIIATHLPLPHPPVLRKRPVLKTITTLPLHAIVGILILVPELDCDLVVGESEQLLAKLVALLLLPLLGQEVDDLDVALEEGAAIAPNTVVSIGFGADYRVLCVPQILPLLYFLVRSSSGEGWDERHFYD